MMLFNKTQYIRSDVPLNLAEKEIQWLIEKI